MNKSILIATFSSTIAAFATAKYLLRKERVNQIERRIRKSILHDLAEYKWYIMMMPNFDMTVDGDRLSEYSEWRVRQIRKLTHLSTRKAAQFVDKVIADYCYNMKLTCLRKIRRVNTIRPIEPDDKDLLIRILESQLKFHELNHELTDKIHSMFLSEIDEYRYDIHDMKKFIDNYIDTLMKLKRLTSSTVLKYVIVEDHNIEGRDVGVVDPTIEYLVRLNPDGKFTIIGCPKGDVLVDEASFKDAIDFVTN